MACRIAFVLFPGFQQLDLAGPMAVFEVARLARPGSYTWRLVCSTPGAVRSSAGVDWPVQALPRRLKDVDLVMVIGGDGVDAACQDARLMAWLARAGRSGPRFGNIVIDDPAKHVERHIPAFDHGLVEIAQIEPPVQR